MSYKLNAHIVISHNEQEVNKIRSNLAQIFAEKVYYGLWFSPECDYIRACLKLSQKLINGFVILQLFKGNAYVRGRKAVKSLYDRQLVRHVLTLIVENQKLLVN